MTDYKEEIKKRLQEKDCYEIPVPIVEFAKKLDFGVYEQILDNGCSGLIAINDKDPIIENFKKIIAVNIKDAYVRQRFTVAHELAHYFLEKENDKKKELYAHREVDGYLDDNECKMNEYAAQLIMPYELLDKFVKQLKSDFSLNDNIYSDMYLIINKIAQEFVVSVSAAERRYLTYKRGV